MVNSVGDRTSFGTSTPRPVKTIDIGEGAPEKFGAFTAT